MISDRLFVVDIIKAAKIHAHLYKSPVYLYQFGYRGRHSLSEHFSKSNENYGNKNILNHILLFIQIIQYIRIVFLGASHADDTGYALRNVYANVEDSELDKSLVPIIVDIWTSFAFKG